MAKLVDKILTLFGRDGDTSNFEQFGSTVNGGAVKTKDIETIQALAAWVNGIQSAVYVAGGYKAPVLEDFNSLFYVLSYFTGYTLQEGIPYWNAGRTYYTGSVVKKIGTSELYMSLSENNTGNALPSREDNSFWKYVTQRGILQYDSSYPYALGELAQKAGTGEIYQSLIAENLGISLPNKTTTANWKYCIDLANVATPSSGIQGLKIGMAHVHLATTVSSSATTVKTPLTDFAFDSDMSVYAFCLLSHSTGVSASSGAPSAFNIQYTFRCSISGTGTDSSGKFVAGGSPSTTYTLTLNCDVLSNIGQGNAEGDATIIFIGIK